MRPRRIRVVAGTNGAGTTIARAFPPHGARRPRVDAASATRPDGAASPTTGRWRAARMARELAPRTAIAIVVARVGKRLRITADELSRPGFR